MPIFPPAHTGLTGQLEALQRKFDELTRRKPSLPVCVVHLASDVSLLASSGDTWAQGGWVATDDQTGMFVAGATGTNSYIQILRAGYYRVHFHCAISGANATAAAKVAVNAANVVGNSIATDAGAIPQQGGDGAVLDAIRSRYYLNVGDKLYWSNWVAANATLSAVVFTIPTEITVEYRDS